MCASIERWVLRRFRQRLMKTISGSIGAIYQYGQDGILLEETNASGAAQGDYIYIDGRPIATMNALSQSDCASRYTF